MSVCAVLSIVPQSRLDQVIKIQITAVYFTISQIRVGRVYAQGRRMILQLGTTGQGVSTRMDEEQFDTGCLFLSCPRARRYLSSRKTASAVMLRYTIEEKV